jgi:Periplasmic copper-binding protein (NosD)
VRSPYGMARRQSDILVLVWFGAVAMGAAACAAGSAPPMGSDALVRQIANMYVDQPVRWQVVAATAQLEAASGSDFQATISMSDQGRLMDASVSPTQGCMEPPQVAGSGRRRSVPSDYPNIQSAVDASSPGDVVFVEAGTYHESVRLRSSISLVGAGASQTTLDGGGGGSSLVDFSGARNVVLQGFTLTGVGMAETPSGCSSDDPFACSGNWYAAAIFGDGSATSPGATSDPCADTSILVAQNVISDNRIGMMSYFHARAIVRNNVFVGNDHGFIANHMQDHALVEHNAFFNNTKLAIGSQAAYLDVVGNLVAGSDVAVNHEFVQTGRISCNAFAQVGSVGDGVPTGQQGNLAVDQAFVDPTQGDFRPTPALAAALVDCFSATSSDDGHLAPWSSAEPGPYGGLLGLWN